MTSGEFNLDHMILIVVGCHLRAEMTDRPLGYRLREQILRWQDESEEDRPDVTPLLCTDMWWLNNSELQSRPTIALGDPEFNAATALLAGRLPTAFSIENTLQIQIDPDLIDVQACLWGVNPGATVSALDAFAERYLDAFLKASTRSLPS